MKRLPLVLLSAVLFAGCSHKSPTALIGKWDRTENNGLFDTTTRLILESDGRFQLTRIGPVNNLTLGGPVTADGQIIESGVYKANSEKIQFNVTTVYLAGKNSGAKLGGNAHLRYTLDDDSLTIENKTLPLAYNSRGIPDPYLAAPGGPSVPGSSQEPVADPNEASPSPMPPTGLKGTPVPVDPMVTFTRADGEANSQPSESLGEASRS